jgi:putative SOS response-associated peptidase YedK
MFSRMEVNRGPLQEWIFDLTGLEVAMREKEIRPGDQLTVVGNRGPGLQQLDASWGIRPAGLAKCVTDTEAETVASSDDYRQTFEERRCVIPCSRWILQRHDDGEQEYSFQAQNSPGLLLAGIWFPADGSADCAILTTRPTAMYAEFDTRMPLLLPPTKVQSWVDGRLGEVEDLLQPSVDIPLKAEKLAIR